MIMTILAALLIVTGVAAQTTRPAAAPATKTLPFLIGADWPADASEAVEKQAADMGINFARINGGGGAWAVESHSKKAKQLEERGIHLLLQLGSHWVPANYFKYTDYYFFDQAGGTGKEDRNSWSVKTGGNDWPQFSYAATGEDFKNELYAEYAKYLAAMKDRTNVIGVILHNEPGLFWQDGKLYDYNPRSIASFREWLVQRYGPTIRRGAVNKEQEETEVLKTLNQRWGSSYKSLDDISPPAKLPPITDPVELAVMLDWRRFQSDAIVKWMQWEYGAAGKILPQRQWALTTNLAGPMDNWQFHRCDNMYRIAQQMDVLGVDIYPNQWTGKLFGEYTMAMARGSAGKYRTNQPVSGTEFPRPVWVLEAQTYDDSHKDLTPEQRGDLLYRDLWTYAAGGAKAVALWRLSDTGGFSLTKGEANPRTAAVKAFAAQAKWVQLERFNPEPASVAVVADPDGLLYAGATSEKLSRTSGVHHNFQGYYAAVRDLRLDADVLLMDRIHDEAIGHKVLILPSAVMMDEVMASRLKNFVESGGVLIVEEGFASLDRFGKPLTDGDGKPLASPGFGLDKVVGDKVQGDVNNMKVTSFGKGRGVILPKNRGQGFLEGWASQPLTGTARDLLPKAMVNVEYAAGEPSKELASARAVSTRLFDDRGNTLVVCTLPNEKMKPLVAETGLRVTLTDVKKAPTRVVLLASDQPNAQPLKFTWKDGRLTFDVDVSSAIAIAFGDNLPE